MSVARLGAGVASCGGALYVVGGYDGQNRWNTAEKYQPDTNTWQQLTPMSTIRSGLGECMCACVCTSVLGGYFYCVGQNHSKLKLYVSVPVVSLDILVCVCLCVFWPFKERVKHFWKYHHRLSCTQLNGKFITVLLSLYPL